MQQQDRDDQHPSRLLQTAGGTFYVENDPNGTVLKACTSTSPQVGFGLLYSTQASNTTYALSFISSALGSTQQATFFYPNAGGSTQYIVTNTIHNKQNRNQVLLSSLDMSIISIYLNSDIIMISKDYGRTFKRVVSLYSNVDYGPAVMRFPDALNPLLTTPDETYILFLLSDRRVSRSTLLVIEYDQATDSFSSSLNDPMNSPAPRISGMNCFTYVTVIFISVYLFIQQGNH